MTRHESADNLSSGGCSHASIYDCLTASLLEDPLDEKCYALMDELVVDAEEERTGRSFFPHV